VTGVATIEGKIGVTRLALRIRNVTLLTSNVCMCPSQRILGLRVIELCSRLPILEVVTRLAIGSETSLVLVAVAAGALA
jgi:hypothetical protein